MKLYKFIKDWILIFSILTGIFSYLIYHSLDVPKDISEIVSKTVNILQPTLIFAMLFLTFTRVNPRRLRMCPYQWWLLLIQCGVFTGLGLLLMTMPHSNLRIILEGTMICFICPTATAGAVVTRKLGGNAAHIITYTIMINLFVALLIPIVVPYVHPNPDISVWTASALILGKVFPLLLLPLIAAFALRWISPKWHAAIARHHEYSFDLWVVALALALAITTRYIVHSNVDLATQLCLVAVSLASCLAQFWLGRKIGSLYGDTVTGGQSLGQKNTILAIWIGYTFFTPITSMVGGFYSIWHNIVNSWQLYRHNNPKN